MTEYVTVTSDAPDARTGAIKLHGPAAFAGMRKAGALVAKCLDDLTDIVKAGVPTSEIDEFVRNYAFSHGAYPATLMYRGYRYSTCTSINHVVCHGMPGDRPLKGGDIVNVDVTLILDGWHGDSSRMFAVGAIPRRAERLIEVTYEAMMRGIRAAVPGRQVNVIGRVIESYARRFGYGVVRDFTGHGIGRSFHSGLVIPHYDAAPAYATVIEPGMTFTVEPMLNLGTPEWDMWDDRWTVVTKDRRRSAQFEHTILVTDHGPEILTQGDAA